MDHKQQAGYGDGAAGLWVMLFTVSKVFELVDTVILVLKGKDPMFLHWCVYEIGRGSSRSRPVPRLCVTRIHIALKTEKKIDPTHRSRIFHTPYIFIMG